eukprot:TRINITY_DN1885_c0_g3_i1.p1 TRINITY_DN1885_c0_g3~~TRINITY_DN1885_c0_g3_i1.p1  ORF type:complete len:257 (+),score=142.44 TRINITY_DN1885_c0_g3_i1:84-773(+)
MSGKEPKKKPKAAKQGPLEPGEDPRMDELELKEIQISRATIKKECLEEEYLVRKQMRIDAHREEQEMRERRDQLEVDYSAQKQERYDIISDFTRQNKSMTDELIIRINDLENTISNLRDQLELSRVALVQMKEEKDQQIKQKEKEINEQAEKMEDMSQEFQSMLNETLEKMNERIDEKHKDGADTARGENDMPSEEDGGAAAAAAGRVEAAGGGAAEASPAEEPVAEGE